MQLRLFTTVALLTACVISPALAQQGAGPAHGWYIGAGVGPSHVAPDTRGTTFTVRDPDSSGAKLVVGYELSDALALEGYYSDLGEATLTPAYTVAYHETGVSALYYFRGASTARSGLSWFVRGGVGFMGNSTQANYRRENNAHLMTGIGLRYPLAGRWTACADWDFYDQDSRLLSLGVSRRFGN